MNRKGALSHTSLQVFGNCDIEYELGCVEYKADYQHSITFKQWPCTDADTPKKKDRCQSQITAIETDLRTAHGGNSAGRWLNSVGGSWLVRSREKGERVLGAAQVLGRCWLRVKNCVKIYAARFWALLVYPKMFTRMQRDAQR
jgi:hypothetical protein